MAAHENTTEKDREIIISIVKEMAESVTGAQSTRHWAADALWFDIAANGPGSDKQSGSK